MKGPRKSRRALESKIESSGGIAGSTRDNRKGRGLTRVLSLFRLEERNGLSIRGEKID